MTGGDTDTITPTTKPRSGPGVVAPTNNVNVALPFSHLHVEESSRGLAELAALVADLATALEQSLPGPNLEQLRERAEGLRAKLQ